MNIKNENRRDFIKKSSLGLFGFTILPSLYGKAPASDRIRIAHIGVNGMGNAHMRAFSGLKDVEIVALCDLDKLHLNKSIENLKTLQPNSKVDSYKDFRDILDRDDIDAITCATPDHWHAQIAMMAFQAGKDVYGEKPLSYDVKEGQDMLKHMNKYDRVFQLGTQIHATDNYHRVVEIIKSGVIGKVHTVRLWKTGGSPDFGNPQVQPVPKTLDWDMWLGPAPKVDYIPEKCHRTYRHFLSYSGGTYADFWSHIADIAFWSLEPTGLSSISARGKEADGISNTPKWIDVDFEFDGLKMYWTTTPPNVPGAAERGIGAYFEGDKGTLICDYGTRSITINGETMKDVDEVPQSITRSPGHHQNFIDSVKSRSQPESNLEYARKMTLPMHLGLISWQLNRPLKWNDKKEKFKGDKEANGMLSRRPRKEWDLV